MSPRDCGMRTVHARSDGNSSTNSTNPTDALMPPYIARLDVGFAARVVHELSKGAKVGQFLYDGILNLPRFNVAGNV